MLQYTPMRLAMLREPFNHPDWIFELKYDGFRALAYVQRDGVRLVSRNRHTYKAFGDLADAIARELRGCPAVLLDGELVCLDDRGRPQFYELMRRRSPVYFCAFDMLEFDGEDLRDRPLLERKRRLRKLIGPSCRRVLYVDHLDGRGAELYGDICRLDLEGIVAKWKYGQYVCGDEQPIDRQLARHAQNPRAAACLTWVKVKNPEYSQVRGRDQLFSRAVDVSAGAYRRSARDSQAVRVGK